MNKNSQLMLTKSAQLNVAFIKGSTNF